MTINIVGILKELLLLQLYNNALYQSPKFDALPAIRQKVAGKSNGILMLAHYLIQEKQDSNHYHFTEIDLGAGPRELQTEASEKLYGAVKSNIFSTLLFPKA